MPANNHSAASDKDEHYVCTQCGNSIYVPTDGELNIRLGCSSCKAATPHQHLETAIDRDNGED